MENKPAQLEFDGVIYEVNITTDTKQKDSLLVWLHTHIDAMLEIPGFKHAKLMEHTQPQGTKPSSFTTTVHYYLDNQKSLEHYLLNDADRMRQDGIDRFGETIQATRRVLADGPDFRNITPESESDKSKTKAPSFEHVGVEHCMNCHTVLTVNFCPDCGQKKQRKAVSIFSIIGEFFGDMFNWDSRFWRTILPLLVKPGYLTKTFLDGKRQRYIPPVRMYLITSIIFFLIVSIQSRLALMNIDPDAPLIQDNSSENIDSENIIKTITDEINNSIEASQLDGDRIPSDGEASFLNGAIVVSNTSPDEVATDAQDKSDSSSSQPSSDSEDSGPTLELNDGKTISFDSEEGCSAILNPDNSFFSNELLRDRAHKICQSLSSRRGLIDFIQELRENLPITLFILLPLMALVHKFMYIFSRRYYVEHLLFYVHGYSFLFVFATFITGLYYAFQLNGVSAGWLVNLAVLYVIYYFLKSMRVVYAQSRFVTFTKWCVINVCFLVLAIGVLTFISIITAAMMV